MIRYEKISKKDTLRESQMFI